MEKRITLQVIDGTWHARWKRVGAAEIRRLFGTDTVPTPFTSETPAAEVKASIEKLNEGFTVEVIE